jgi:hypothetical protein
MVKINCDWLHTKSPRNSPNLEGCHIKIHRQTKPIPGQKMWMNEIDDVARD